MQHRGAGAAAIGELLRPFIVDRVFVLVGAPVRPLSFDATTLLDLGARHVMIVGDGMGAIELAPRDGLSWEVLDVAASTWSEGRFRAGRLLSDLPHRVLAALDAVDPDREAWVVNANNGYTGATVAGRRVLGRSRVEWTAWEDKTTCDGLWQAAGVPQAPYEIVPTRRDDLLDAARRLDQGDGTVWAGDTRDLVHAGAELTRWVRDTDDVEAVARLLASNCDRARVMPFLEGIPCSIHGVMAVDGVAALRPCEMIVVRDRSPGHLHFVGMGTGWDPVPDDREEMRDVARRVGGVLRDRYGFRGTFTVDGVMTVDGFRPTELNPRIGGALGLMSQAIPEMGLLLHTQFLAHGIDTGLRAADVEQVVVPAADTNRAVLVVDVLAADVDPVVRSIVLDGDTPRYTVADEVRDGVARIARVRSYLPSAAIVQIDPGHLPVGPSSAPLATAALDLAKVAAGLPAEGFKTARAMR
jgi:hypothetical protein